MKDVKLADYVRTTGFEKFKWGVLDCVLFTAGWCELISGKNPAEGFKGQYGTEETAYAFLEEKCGNNPEAIVDNFFQRVEPNFEQTGDVALCLLNGNKAFGICAQKGLMIFKTADKVLITKLCEKLICWRVE